MSAEIPGSAMLSSSRFISAMASRPSFIILSNSALPVEGSSSFFGSAAGADAFASPRAPPRHSRLTTTKTAADAMPSSP